VEDVKVGSTKTFGGMRTKFGRSAEKLFLTGRRGVFCRALVGGRYLVSDLKTTAKKTFSDVMTYTILPPLALGDIHKIYIHSIR
jgi:hypothetical protein